MTERRAHWLWIAAVLLLVLAPTCFKAADAWNKTPYSLQLGATTGPTDPDPWLRLTLVREWMMEAGWYDHRVLNTNAPMGGITSPWTRPLDLVITMFVGMQSPDTAVNNRLMRAALLLPPLWMGLLLAGIFYGVRRFTPLPPAYRMAAAMLSAMPATWNYFGLGNADHHASLAALFIWAVAIAMRPALSNMKVTVVALLLAMMLWISFEAMMPIAIVYGWFAICWLRGERDAAVTLTKLSSWTAVFAAIAFAIEVPTAAWATPHYDTISMPYIALLLAAASVAWLMRGCTEMPLARRLGVTGGGAVLALGIVLALYPDLRHGPYANLDPYITSTFMKFISEAKPFYRADWAAVIATIYLPLAVLALATATWRRPVRAFYDRPEARMLAYFVGMTLIMYLSQQRWSYYLLPLTAVALAPVIAAMFSPTDPHVAKRWPASALAKMPEGKQALLRMPLLVALLAFPLALVSLKSALPEPDGNAAFMRARDGCYADARRLIRSYELSNLLGEGPHTLWAPTDLGAELLFFTPYHIVASNYHREGAGIRYIWESERINDERKLRATLAERKIDIVLLCPSLVDKNESLLAAYHAGKPLPHWLKKVPYTLPALEKPKKDEPYTPPMILRVTDK